VVLVGVVLMEVVLMVVGVPGHAWVQTLLNQGAHDA
jgi:hypothetical protein